MKRIAVLASVAGLVSTGAFAADLPSRSAPVAAPYMAAPIFTWTGFYAGAQLGGGWVSDKGRYDGSLGVARGYRDLDSSGVLGGLFAGYNYQIGVLVLGAEADVEATSLSTTTSTYFPAAGGASAVGQASERLPWQGSLRARVGYAMGNVLFYATGGLALADIDTKYYDAPFNAVSYSNVQAGWTVGGGIEYAITDNWRARVEYRYSQFAGFSENASAPAIIVRHGLNENQVRVGVAYKFSAPTSAVVAKY